MKCLINCDRSNKLDTAINEVEKRKKSDDFLHFIIVLIIVVISDDTILFGTNQDSKFIILKYLIIITMFLVLFVNTLIGKINISKKIFFITFLLLITIMSACFFNLDFRFGYIYRGCIIIMCMQIPKIVSFQRFAFLYNKIMEVLAISSLVGYSIYILLPGFLSLFPILYNSADNAFYTFYLSNISVYSYGFHRNYGIFREPGVYQMFLIVAMLFQVFVIPKPKIRTQIIYILSILTTFSTTGYIALFFIVFIYMIKNNKYKKDSIKKVIFILILFLMLAYLLLFTDYLSNTGYASVFGKLFDRTQNTTNSRLASVIVNIKLFLQSPIWGVGLTNVEILYTPISAQIMGIPTKHNTNTIFIQLAQYGMFFTTIWIVGIYRLSKIIWERKIVSFLIFILFIILFIGEILSFSIITNILCFYGFYGNYKKNID